MAKKNVSEVNRERSRLAAASSVCDLTKHNGLVTIPFFMAKDSALLANQLDAGNIQFFLNLMKHQ